VLIVCSAVAAPAPKTKPFETGWDKPVDPDGDKDVPTIEVWAQIRVWDSNETR